MNTLNNNNTRASPTATPHLSPSNTPKTSGKYLDNQGKTLYSGKVARTLARTSSLYVPVQSSSLMKTAFVIKSPCVFEAAAKDILLKLSENENISVENTISIISKYEMASETVENHFPGAKPSRKILEHVLQGLANYDVTPQNTLFAQSICPDEINHTNGGIGDVFREYFGECFYLGGLAGIPFTGNKGFTTFSNHVPDGGNLFILFAPHIGLSETYKFGHYSRRGQCNDGSACGAAVGALNHCLACKPIPTNQMLGANPYDYQMNWIITQLSHSTRLNTITNKKSDNEKQVELAQQMFEISKEFLLQIVHTRFGSVYSNLILLGGIQINMPGPQQDFFQPLFFEVHHQDRSRILPPSSLSLSLSQPSPSVSSKSPLAVFNRSISRTRGKNNSCNNNDNIMNSNSRNTSGKNVNFNTNANTVFKIDSLPSTKSSSINAATATTAITTTSATTIALLNMNISTGNNNNNNNISTNIDSKRSSQKISQKTAIFKNISIEEMIAPKISFLLPSENNSSSGNNISSGNSSPLMNTTSKQKSVKMMNANNNDNNATTANSTNNNNNNNNNSVESYPTESESSKSRRNNVINIVKTDLLASSFRPVIEYCGDDDDDSGDNRRRRYSF